MFNKRKFLKLRQVYGRDTFPNKARNAFTFSHSQSQSQKKKEILQWLSEWRM